MPGLRYVDRFPRPRRRPRRFLQTLFPTGFFSFPYGHFERPRLTRLDPRLVPRRLRQRRLPVGFFSLPYLHLAIVTTLSFPRRLRRRLYPLSLPVLYIFHM